MLCTILKLGLWRFCIHYHLKNSVGLSNLILVFRVCFILKIHLACIYPSTGSFVIQLWFQEKIIENGQAINDMVLRPLCIVILTNNLSTLIIKGRNFTFFHKGFLFSHILYYLNQNMMGGLRIVCMNSQVLSWFGTDCEVFVIHCTCPTKSRIKFDVVGTSVGLR